MNKTEKILCVIKILQNFTQKMTPPAATEIIRIYGRDPFLILTSCILSLRTKDTVSLPASIRLFELGKMPKKILRIPIDELERVIYPVGFYRQKARQLHLISHQIHERFKGSVPCTQEELLTLPGVGLKTANLVLSEGFQIPALCVDTHVHRISNRLGWVSTKTPEETEHELKKIIPSHYWREINSLLVMWGQNQCLPLSPLCSSCPLRTLCPQNSVKKNR